MFGGHIWELLIVLALALVVFGPKRLPEIGGAMGKGIREFRKGTSGPVALDDPEPAQGSFTTLPSRETGIPAAASAEEVEQQAHGRADSSSEPVSAQTRAS
jgi:sec-independent protein translocase protein TatA